MEIFDLKTMKSHSYEERDKNVFYNVKEFKTKIIELPINGEMPACEMASYVIFYVIEGAVEVKINQEKIIIKEGECLITEPAVISMGTKNGAKLMGIQIAKN